MKKTTRKKKITIIAIIIIVIVGIVLATVSINWFIQNTVKSGNLTVDDINLQIKDSKGNITKELKTWEPGDVNELKWNVKNTGTSSIRTRNKLQIYWNEEVPQTIQKQNIYLYPANMTKEEIWEDYKKGENSEYAIDVNYGEITIDNETKIGMEYQFLGDTLNGSSEKNAANAEETNYNNSDFEITTDDNIPQEDIVAFNMLFSPNTSYLFGDKTVTIKVVTEAMQYTKDGQEDWQVVNTQTIN